MYKKPPSPTPIGKDGNHTASVQCRVMYNHNNSTTILYHARPKKSSLARAGFLCPFSFDFCVLKTFLRTYSHLYPKESERALTVLNEIKMP